MNRIREHLWFRPFTFCILSIVSALIAHQADGTVLKELVPEISADSIKSLLNTLSASMLVISVFAVASMLSAYAAATSTATPRSFKIIVRDDVSQNALSAFIGAFIFSIVASVALGNGYFGKAGKFVLFLFTLLFFAVVILTFLRWVDRISRLGRMEHTIKQVEAYAHKALADYIRDPLLQALPITGDLTNTLAITSDSVGYVQNLNLEILQDLAAKADLLVRLNCLPGKFVHRNFVLAYINAYKDIDEKEISKKVHEAICIGDTRLFDEDPRFGLITLSEIASRALSPGINDPGTAIQIIGSHEKLFFLWEQRPERKILFDRIQVPEISMEEFFEDAFRPISRDAAANIEVMLRLQKTFKSLATIDQEELKKAAIRYSREAFERAELKMEFRRDLKLLRNKCLFVDEKQTC